MSAVRGSGSKTEAFAPGEAEQQLRSETLPRQLSAGFVRVSVSDLDAEIKKPSASSANAWRFTVPTCFNQKSAIRAHFC